MLSKKDLIAINEKFSNGKIVNQSSMEFVLETTKKSKHWYKTMCLLTRAILIDHVFEDGNKRTAAAMIMAYLDMNDYTYNPDAIGKIVLLVARKNITDTNKIGRMIKHGIRT
ncbi:Fic family protein [Candidatus Woesearchaeota archaeon]|nr:Fic family protein [Candidatus Woesearchaeota archaeon]